MDHRQDALHASIRFWSSRSEAFLMATERLPDEEDFAAPRAELLARALECRLKAFLYAARGGAPPTDDLSHLVHLAALCGLAWDDRQRAIVAGLMRARLSAQGAAAPGPEPSAVRALCESIP